MDDLIKTFHIDWKLLIAQIINFVIVIVVLGLFAIKPLMKIMKERQDKIQSGIDNADRADETLAEAEKIKEDKIREGRIEASAVIENAEKQAEQLRQEKTEKAQKEVQKVIADAKQKIKSEKEVMLKEAKDGISDLVVAALNKVIVDSTDSKDKKKIIDKAIDEFKDVDFKKS